MYKHRPFRGYNAKHDKWLYGYYFVNRGKHYIVTDEIVNPFAEPDDYEVAPDSIGQWIGKTKYNDDVYEGDIVTDFPYDTTWSAAAYLMRTESS